MSSKYPKILLQGSLISCLCTKAPGTRSHYRINQDNAKKLPWQLFTMKPNLDACAYPVVRQDLHLTCCLFTSRWLVIELVTSEEILVSFPQDESLLQCQQISLYFAKTKVLVFSCTKQELLKDIIKYFLKFINVGVYLQI